MSSEEFKTLLLGVARSTSDENTSLNINPKCPSFLSEDRWADVCTLAKQFPRAFGDVPEFMSKAKELDFQHVASTFGLSKSQILVLKKVSMPHQLVHSVRHFVGHSLGKVFTSSPPFDLKSCYDDSQSFTPLIFILSSGADPMSYLQQLAISKGKRRSMRVVSLGQGQGPLAE